MIKITLRKNAYYKVKMNLMLREKEFKDFLRWIDSTENEQQNEY